MTEIPGASRPAALRFELPCDLKEVRHAAQTVHHFLAEQGCDEQILSACELALVEACNNAIKYAPKAAQGTPVVVEVICTARVIELRVTDHNLGFDWPKHIDLPDPESESGRGLYLIESLMDSVNYLRGNGENVLVMRKSWLSLTGREGAVARGMMTSEREIAGAIQKSLLIKELPQFPGFELAAMCQNAEQTGGDFYDALKIGDDSVLLVIADVMGKGAMATMFAAILRAALRSAPELSRDPAALLARVNQVLFEQLSGADMFITAQLAFVNTTSRNLIAASAGHCPLLLANGHAVKDISPEGMPLGILPDTVFTSEMVYLPRNSRVLLYTDGLTEALDANGERYGQERLSAWLTKVNGSARELKEELAGKLAQFQTKTALNDDQTFLIMTG